MPILLEFIAARGARLTVVKSTNEEHVRSGATGHQRSHGHATHKRTRTHTQRSAWRNEPPSPGTMSYETVSGMHQKRWPTRAYAAVRDVENGLHVYRSSHATEGDEDINGQEDDKADDQQRPLFYAGRQVKSTRNILLWIPATVMTLILCWSKYDVHYRLADETLARHLNNGPSDSTFSISVSSDTRSILLQLWYGLQMSLNPRPAWGFKCPHFFPALNLEFRRAAGTPSFQ